jgi:hypothetical protein
MQGLFVQFVDSHYYSKSELVEVWRWSLFQSTFLGRRWMYFLQHSAHVSKMCCSPLITLKFLASELPFHDWKSPVITWGEIWIVIFILIVYKITYLHTAWYLWRGTSFVFIVTGNSRCFLLGWFTCSGLLSNE